MPLPLLLLPLFLLVTAVIALTVGLRGRQTDNHPLCRHCNFDLTGRPTTSILCPECGVDLTTDRAVRIGHRQRRPLFILLGALLLLAALSVLTTLTLSNIQGDKAEAWKPLWWVAADTASNNSKLRNVAIRELLTRVKSKKLSSRQIESIAARALAVQGDDKQTWDERWGEMMELAHTQDLLSTAAWSRFASQAIDIDLKVRPRVGQGEYMCFQTGGKIGRRGPTVLFKAEGEMRITVGGREYVSQDDKPEFDVASATLNSSHSFLHPLPPTATRGLPAGPQKLHIWGIVNVNLSGTQTENITPLASRRLDFETTFELLPAGESSVELLDEPGDPSPRNKPTITLRNFHVVNNCATMQATLAMPSPGFPYDLTSQSYIRFADREWPLGQYICWACRHPTIHATWSLDNYPANLPPPKVLDLIIRPDPEIAQRTLDLFNIWGREIIFKDVSVDTK